MSGLILTKKKPGVSLAVGAEGKRIYSMEELCYYLYHNIYTLDKSFFDEAFFEFLRKMDREALIQKLNVALLTKKHYAQLVLEVIKDSDYYSGREKQEMEHVFSEIMTRTPAENLKVRADALKERGENCEAEKCYRQLLESEELKAGERMQADAWNNIGVIRAEVFLYREALDCFRRAMNICPEQEYLDNIICALIMAEKSITDMEPGEVQRLKEKLAAGYEIPEETFAKYEEVILREEKNIACSQETLEFQELVSVSANQSRAEYYGNMEKIIGKWKLEYRMQEQREE